MAFASTALAATTPKAGTYAVTPVTTASACGAAVGTISNSVFNLAGPGKKGNYPNLAVPNTAGNSVYNITFTSALPTASGTWTGKSTSTIESAGGSTVVGTVTFTDAITFVYASTFIGSDSDSSGCTSNATYIRVGK